MSCCTIAARQRLASLIVEAVEGGLGGTDFDVMVTVTGQGDGYRVEAWRPAEPADRSAIASASGPTYPLAVLRLVAELLSNGGGAVVPGDRQAARPDRGQR